MADVIIHRSERVYVANGNSFWTKNLPLMVFYLIYMCGLLLVSTYGAVGMVVGFVGAVGPQLSLLRAIRFSGSNATARYHLASSKQIRWEDWEWKTGLFAVVAFLGVVLTTTELSYSSSWVVIVALLSTFTWMSVVGVILDRGKMKSMTSRRNTAE